MVLASASSRRPGCRIEIADPGGEGCGQKQCAGGKGRLAEQWSAAARPMPGSNCPCLNHPSPVDVRRLRWPPPGIHRISPYIMKTEVRHNRDHPGLGLFGGQNRVKTAPPGPKTGDLGGRSRRRRAKLFLGEGGKQPIDQAVTVLAELFRNIRFGQHQRHRGPSGAERRLRVRRRRFFPPRLFR